ncbi:MAG TPA: Na+/H+ antiporter [Candidatus Limnocylindria bacterium]|nr:Na+/H+ antiporter [Candidatus Limnocylindria bacterium]
MALTVAFTPVAQRLRLAEPIAFVIGGLLVSLVPGFPLVELDPGLVFVLILPPLLFVQAYFTPWRAFCANLRPILLLAVGLVLFTAVGVALFVHWLVPAIPLAATFALGAIVSPPDAVAVAAVAHQLHLPRRLVTVLEGESLVNDATGLVILRFALAALSAGTFSLPLATVSFVQVALGGVAVGLAAGWLMLQVRRLLLDDAWQVTLSLLTPFGAYLPAERLHLSGVLAVVACGIYLGTMLPQRLTFSARLLGSATWRMIDSLLTGVVFVLIGLQLRVVVAGLKADYSWAELIGWSVAVSVLVIGLRPLWIFPITHIQRWIIPGLRARDPAPRWQEITVMSWAGVRGVVSLAAALALPMALPDGTAFPGRDLLIFLTFAVILATLVVQGLSFPWLVRRLGVRERTNRSDHEREVRLALARAGLAAVESQAQADNLNDRAIRAVRDLYEERISESTDEVALALGWSPQMEHSLSWHRLRHAALKAEHEELRRLREQDRLTVELVLVLGRELDLEEARLRH